MKRIILISLFIWQWTTIYCQSVVSPNVEKLIERGIVPVSGFTGQANVQVPLYTVAYRDISVPIVLNYDTKGNKVKQHPGFSGLGWSLSAGGGAIYRKVVAEKDEIYRTVNGVTYTYDIGYYYTGGRVADTYNDINTVKKFARDGANLPVNDYAYDGSPDEFYFNFNGYSGVFYITRQNSTSPPVLRFLSDGNYTLKGEITEIKDNVQFEDSPNQSGGMYTQTSQRCIYGIKITDDKGYQYIFGNSVNNIEFTNSGTLGYSQDNIATAWYISKIISPNGYSTDFEYERKGRLIVPDTFRDLTISSGSYNFKNYAQFLLVFSVSWGSGGYQYYGSLQRSTYSFIYPSYLKSIKTPLQEVTFHYSPSGELAYNMSGYEQPTIGQLLYATQSPDPNGGRSYWQKLDEVRIGRTNKTLRFRYREQSDTRLRLDEILLGVGTGTSFLKDQEYRFVYNEQLLPNYESRAVDHWGYFNGNEYGYNSTYYANRQPNGTYLQAEMLKKIQYPEGGVTILDYEPHTYSKVAFQYPFTVRDTTSNLIAGGLRIKSIISSPEDGSAPKKTEYFYSRNYITAGAVSSGVLAGNPRYSNSGSRFSSYKSGDFWSGSSGSVQAYYQRGMDRNFFPLGLTKGAHITYSEVTEKTTGNGYITRIYSNHDNGYMDGAPLLMHSNFNSEQFEDPFISFQAYRGLELIQKIYNNSKVLQKETVNTYQTATLNAYGVPFIQRVEEGDIGGTRASSGAYPTVTPSLKSSIVKELRDGNMIETTNTELFYLSGFYGDQDISVNRANNITFYEVNNAPSNNIGRMMDYQFPFSFPKSVISVREHTYRTMKIKNMLAYPVVTANNKTRYINNAYHSTPVSQDIIDYGTFDNIIAPARIYRMNFDSKTINYLEPAILASYYDNGGTAFWREYLRVDSRAVLLKEITKYDIYGNPLEIIENGKPQQVYLWGYCGQYLIAEINNATYDEIFGILGQSTIDALNSSAASETTINNAIKLLRNNASLKKAQITSYTYAPFIGIKSRTDSRGIIESYEYDVFNRLIAVKNHTGDIIRTYCYNLNGKLYDCNGNRRLPENAYVVNLAYKSFIDGSGEPLCASTDKKRYYFINAGNEVSPGIVVGTVLFTIEGNYAPAGYYSRGPSIAYVSGSDGTVTAINQCSDQWIEW
ncbi:hypothetical protein [Sphingobacterium sp. UME9]|uniref:hypothetical protein n=1 Tax=Sphingobacterium sp. UME9 TaxID=1862316 RepID=UPI0016032CD0|nr:hypothetical protein [Sphingobacterium sp. UME9]MBB1644629.1 hypothetical protein [Sphingobacterium sp. UME9]